MAQKTKEDELIERFDAAKVLRAQWESDWEDAYEFTLPKRKHEFTDTFNEGETRTDRIFDSTAVAAHLEFASRMQAGTVPGDSQWISLKAGSRIDPDDREEFDRALAAVVSDLFESLASSNFNTEANEMFIELGIGTGPMIVEDGGLDAPFKFTAVPLTEVWLDEGPFGGVDGVFRRVRVRAKHVPVRWAKAKLSDDLRRVIADDAERKLTFIELTSRDWAEKGTETYVRQIMNLEHKEIIVTEEFTGAGSNPWIVPRWAVSAGEVYGRGPVLNALPDIRSLNLIKQMILENADFAISGLYLFDDDGTINPTTIDLTPGALVPRSPGSRGLEPLQSASRFDVGEFIIKDMQFNIQKLLFSETLGRPEGTPMTATEVAARTSELAQQIGSPFGRIVVEFVRPVIRRLLFLLKDRGALKGLPGLGGDILKIDSISPLSRAADFEKISALDRFLEVVAARLGPQALQAMVKTEETVNELATLFGVTPTVIRSESELRTQEAETEAAAAGAAEAGVPPEQIAQVLQQGAP